MNKLLFLLLPPGAMLLVMGFSEMDAKEPLQLEFEGTAMALPFCSLSEAKEGKLGYSTAMPDTLTSQAHDGYPGSIKYALSDNARARISLTAEPEFLKAPTAANHLDYVFQPSFSALTEDAASEDPEKKNDIAVPRGGAGQLDIHLHVTTVGGISLPAGETYLAQVTVTCEPML